MTIGGGRLSNRMGASDQAVQTRLGRLPVFTISGSSLFTIYTLVAE